MTPEKAKINLGCGKVKFKSWINIDINPDADVVLDLKYGLPFKDNSIDCIYSEHVIEHFVFSEGQMILKECHRILSKGGIIRIATPDLDFILQKYLSDWKSQEWLSWPEYEFIKTKGQMINIVFSWWDHKYLYNEEDLKNQLIKAGFSRIDRVQMSQSFHPEFCNLETRDDSKLIFECIKGP